MQLSVNLENVRVFSSLFIVDYFMFDLLNKFFQVSSTVAEPAINYSGCQEPGSTRQFNLYPCV